MFSTRAKQAWHLLTSPSKELHSKELSRRAHLLAALTIPLIIVTGIGGFFAPFATTTEQLSVQALFVVLLISYLISRTKYFIYGGLLAIITLHIPPYIELYTPNELSIYAVTYHSSWFSLPILLGSLWLPIRAVSFIWLLNLLFFISLPLQLPSLETSFIIIPWLQLVLIGSLILLSASIRNKDLRQLIVQSQDLSASKIKAESALETKSMFLSNMSHEVRTPMHGLLGMLEILNSTELNAKQKNYSLTAIKSAKNLLNLLNNILDFTTVETNKLVLDIVDTDINQLVNNVVSLFTFQASEKNIKLICNVSDKISPSHKADPTRLRQVLSNLISNAIKFTEQGEISVSVKLNNETDDTQYLTFEIKDSGIGIPKEKIKHIYESFTQADGSTTRKYGGTGLGLTISKLLIEKMDGNIELKSTEAIGSTFTFKIPFKISTNTEQTTTSAPFLVKPENISSHPDKVLVVEDNLVNQMVAVTMLKKLGLDYDVANNGEEAVEKFIENQYRFIFMDCQMPVMNGYEATHAIRKIEHESDKNRTPIIAITANALKGDREKCIECGMDDYIVKPFSLDDINNAINNWQ